MPAHQQRPSTTNNKFLKNWESFKLGVHAYSWRVLNTGGFGIEWGKGWQSPAPVDWDLGQSVKSTVTFHRFQLAPSVPGGWVPQNSSSMSFRLIFTFKKEWEYLQLIHYLHTVHGVLKARLLKWFAIPFSSGPHSVRPLHHDPSVLGGPTRHGLVSLS